MAPRRRLVLQPSGRRGLAEEGQTLRSAARELGVEIESICAENATCGKCKVLVEEGDFEKDGIHSACSHLSPVGPDEAAYFERRKAWLENQGWAPGQVRLACQAHLQGDVVIFIPEESRRGRQLVRKSLSGRPVEILPSIRKYYVEIPPPTLDDPSGDWERLKDALQAARRRVHPQDASLPPPEELRIDYALLPTLSAVLREAGWRVTASVWLDREVVSVQPGLQETSYGAAVDIGSTTLALYLCDLGSGEVLASVGRMNPQVAYGDDIMSRIQYCNSHPDGLKELNAAVIGALNELLAGAAREAGISPEDILEMVLVGNTVMQHLALNISPEELGRAPYTPVVQHPLDIKARELRVRIHPAGNIHILPSEASFVGGDNVAVLIAEEPYEQDENWLIIDIGTNAELVLGNRHGLLCTSTPTGPALEGAQIEFGMRASPGAIERVQIDPLTFEPRYRLAGLDAWRDAGPGEAGLARGICGSGIIDAVAELVQCGLLDASGRFVKDRPTSRLRRGERGWEYVLAWEGETALGRDLTLNARDIRQVQLAKAALYTAARFLLDAAGLASPDKILLAGAFGNYIDPAKALRIGLIPACPVENVIAIGNAAGEGARLALLSTARRRDAARIAWQVRRIELPADPAFGGRFLQALNFPE